MIFAGTVFTSSPNASSNGRLVVFDSRGSILGSPEGAYTFIFPRLAHTGDGELYLMWGEPASHDDRTGVTRWLLPRVASVWAARYDLQKRTWGKAERVFESKDEIVQWNSKSPRIESMALKGGGIFLVLPYHARNSVASAQSGIVHVRLDASGWHANTVRLPGVALVADVVGDSRTLRTAFIGGDSQNSALNAVLYAQSNDGGSTWANIKQLHRFGESVEVEQISLLTRNGSVVVLWKGALGTSSEGWTSRRLSASAAEWERPLSIAYGAMGGETLSIDDCGRVYLVFESRGSNQGRRIVGATLDSLWNAPTELYVNRIAYDPQLAYENGAGWMTFIARAGDSLPGRLYLTRARLP